MGCGGWFRGRRSWGTASSRRSRGLTCLGPIEIPGGNDGVPDRGGRLVFVVQQDAESRRHPVSAISCHPLMPGKYQARLYQSPNGRESAKPRHRQGHRPVARPRSVLAWHSRSSSATNGRPGGIRRGRCRSGPAARVISTRSSCATCTRRWPSWSRGRSSADRATGGPVRRVDLGSVAVGKSTSARALATLLEAHDAVGPGRVAQVSTDGFLFPNRVLEERGIMERKGFPESFDTRAPRHVPRRAAVRARPRCGRRSTRTSATT